MIHKRQRNYSAAVELWEHAAQSLSLEAFLELAKYYEHQVRDYTRALYWTQTAIDSIESQQLDHVGTFTLSLYERRQWLSELNHRLTRLSGKLTRSA